jgi:hypothetical protein
MTAEKLKTPHDNDQHVNLTARHRQGRGRRRTSLQNIMARFDSAIPTLLRGFQSSTAVVDNGGSARASPRPCGGLFVIVQKCKCLTSENPTEYITESLFTSVLDQKGYITMRNGVLLARGRGGFGSIVGWLIRVVIYDICITTISDVLHVPRIVALFIFLGILAVIAFAGYLLKSKYASNVEDDD